MSSFRFLRLAVRPRYTVAARTGTGYTKTQFSASRYAGVRTFQSSARQLSDPHAEESFEEFCGRYEKEFDAVNDVFELQRNLNNAFAYDLVPSPAVIVAALRAARRVNDYPTAVRVFEGLKAKVENPGQYEEYLEDTKSIRDELGVDLKEDLYPERANERW